jgi:GDP/UDP-N,N'-diacetylbacillosamine 2-epimerase (hydrolysing)
MLVIPGCEVIQVDEKREARAMKSGKGRGPRRICIVTGSRAEYGLLKPVMDEILNADSLELQVVATGMHLLPEYGNTVDLIRNDGIRVDAAVPLILGGDTRSSMAASIGVGIVELTSVYDLLNPHVVVVLGDRFETLAAAIAASYTGRVLAHISGGDVSGGGFDEYTRHAITKIAHIHFPSTKESAERITKMGERNVFPVGSTAMDVIKDLLPYLSDRAEVLRRYNLKDPRPLALVVHHPVTIGEEEGLENLLRALTDSGCNGIVVYPNADPGSKKVIDELLRFTSGESRDPGMRLVRNLPQREYFEVMNAADFMIGNSSSGIIETPYFKKPSIQVGSRQAGRASAGNVLSAGTGYDEIRDAIRTALQDKAFAEKVRTCINPYGYGGASRKIAEVLGNLVIDEDLLRKKMTY